MAAFLEQRLGMGFLEIAAADLGGRDLRGDRQHRHARAMAIEQAVDEVQIAGSAAPRADGELAGQMRLGAGREGGDFFVPDVDPFDLALAADRVGQTVQAVADDAVDALDAGGREGFGELIRNVFISYLRCLQQLAPALRQVGDKYACRGLVKRVTTTPR